jgi:hypothetical protein
MNPISAPANVSQGGLVVLVCPIINGTAPRDRAIAAVKNRPWLLVGSVNHH